MAMERFGDLMIDPFDVRSASVVNIHRDPDQESYRDTDPKEHGLILLKDGETMDCRPHDLRILLARLESIHGR